VRRIREEPPRPKRIDKRRSNIPFSWFSW
jgi:hypothetical protein